ncbi:hypothetical protein DXA98_04455 [Lachnospiraceae bacterium OF09-6]|nr:hypothetical protein DXA98_04455 [Lachnospiraceae bacterium OF09-6]
MEYNQMVRSIWKKENGKVLSENYTLFGVFSVRRSAETLSSLSTRENIWLFRFMRTRFSRK